MKNPLMLSALAVSVATLTAPSAHALGVIFTETHDYGTGQYEPGGNDMLGADFVTVSDDSSSRFSDAFDFSTLTYDTITQFDLTLTFSDAGPSGLGFKEAWAARVPGTNSSFTGQTGGSNAGSANDFFDVLFDAASPQKITLSMATDTTGGIDAFSEAVRIEKFIFGFSEFSGAGLFGNLPEPDDFDLDSAQLDIVGVVPLPGAVWLLGGLTGLGLVASRRKSHA